MKKIISLILISILSLSTTFAWNNWEINTDIEINDLKVLSQWEKIVNNMNCSYLEIWNIYNVKNAKFLEISENWDLVYESIDYSNDYKPNWKYAWYNIKTKETTIIESDKIKKESTRVIQNKPEISKVLWFWERANYSDWIGWYIKFDAYIDNKNEIYNWNSKSIEFSIPTRWRSLNYINKDWFYIYESSNPRYSTNGNFSFTYEPYQEDRIYVFYNCKNIISTQYQSKLNKILNTFFWKLDEYRLFDIDNSDAYEEKSEIRKAKFNSLISKIDLIILKTTSEKKKFILEYIKESAIFHRDDKKVLWLGNIETINDIWVSDFIN